MFPWCIVTDLSLVSSSPYDEDLSLYVILKALSWIRFFCYLNPLLWNTHIGRQQPNCNSMNDFIIIRFLLRIIKCLIRASALSFSLDVLHKLLTWLSNFISWLIVILRRTSALPKSMGKSSISAVVAPEQLIIKWLLSLFSFMKLNHPRWKCF